VQHAATIAQICRAISSNEGICIDNRKNIVKQEYLRHMSLQYGELRPTCGWDRFVSLGHPR